MPCRSSACLLLLGRLAATAAAAVPAPTGLQCDWRATPSVGVSASPSFAWVVPHLPRRAGCGASRSAVVDDTDQLQHSYQVQVLAGAGEALVLHHDTQRVVANKSSSVALALLPALLPGTTYTWRVRVWTSVDREEACASDWALGRFATALFDGFDATPIWLADTPAAPAAAAVSAPRAGVSCDLSGAWKGNGNGGRGVPITISRQTAVSSGAAKKYVAKCKLWTNVLTDLGNGTLVLHHGSGPVLRLFLPCALISHAQGSSGVVDNMPFAWRGHTKSLTTRPRLSPDLAVWLE